MRLVLIFSCLILLASACKTSKKAQISSEQTTEQITDESFRKVIRDREIYASITETVPLDSAYISRDTLHIHTVKMNGCDAEEFKLIWNGALLKSLPAQTNVKLFHRLEPACREQHSFHLTFNVAPLRMRHDTALVSNGSSSFQHALLLRIYGWKAPIRYEY
ncbi:MAG: hypothetical protein IPP77_03575 [Bacteroidetes bacterium]|nr:hypothetical protein [Bacteroidota bacterium]